MIEMKVQGIALDPVTNMPVVVLKSEDTDDILSIWIGTFEANAIAMKLENILMPRPMTYDLLASLIDSLNGKVEHIYINDLQANTYYAEISVLKDGQVIKIDARPSDAINIALRCGAPIYVSPKVIEAHNESKILDMEEDDIKEWLESLKPEDFKIE